METAIRFATWLADNRWYRNGQRNEWYQIPKQNYNRTIEQLFELFNQ